MTHAEITLVAVALVASVAVGVALGFAIVAFWKLLPL